MHGFVAIADDVRSGSPKRGCDIKPPTMTFMTKMMTMKTAALARLAIASAPALALVQGLVLALLHVLVQQHWIHRTVSSPPRLSSSQLSSQPFPPRSSRLGPQPQCVIVQRP
ncbi:hypothetical protein QCA50_016321 [Cerrena zonata]|uniref:Uncharacterized protein n=1 Tax=Cerrena zonata TaxID=2478898 RepID=A0AAW0FNE9_9APHY